MVSLKGMIPDNFNPHLYTKPDPYLTGGDPRAAFIMEMQSHGLKPPSAITLGKLMRFPDAHDKGLDKTGWCFYLEVPDEARMGVIGVGSFGSWRGDPEKIVWCSKKTHSMTMSERQHYDESIRKIKERQEQEERERHEQTKKQAEKMWQNAYDADPEHPYLVRKNVGAHNIKESDNVLYVPIYDRGEICNIERIYADGQKRGLKGGKRKGCYSFIGAETAIIYVAEGYSTAATVHEATGCRVYISFNAGNIYEVSSFVRSEHPVAHIIIAADNDHENKVNIGKNKAEQAAQALGIEYVLPADNQKDFNDLGLEKTRKQLSNTPEVYKQEKITSNKAINPTGILADIAGYYNATSGNEQREFAVQTALCICSVILGRNFKTNKNNFTSMYFVNVAKSSTGKEHCKSVIENVLDACGMDHLVAGDGYTSAGAVFSGLLEKPRHVAIFDEFGRYLEAANKMGGSMLQEANTKLMESIGRAHGIMRPPVYSTMSGSISKEKAKELQDRRIINPALTIMAMSTPSTMFGNLNVGAINDGFLNRFVICISDAERSIRKHKDHVDVPERIIKWVDAINNRIGIKPESAMDRPDYIELQISDEAMEVSDRFQLYCIDVSNRLDEMNMSEISGRANEMAMRTSLICALSRDPEAEVITKEDMEWSVEYIKLHLDRLLGVLKMSVSTNEHESSKKAILKSIRDAGESGVSWSHMQRRAPFSGHKKRDLEEILGSLIDGDLIFVEEESTGGRPSKVYKAKA